MTIVPEGNLSRPFVISKRVQTEYEEKRKSGMVLTGARSTLK